MVDAAAVAATLVGLSRLAADRPDVVAVDINPLIVVDGKPVAVDALVELDPAPARPRAARRVRPTDEAFRALFEPRGVIVAGASTHPGVADFIRNDMGSYGTEMWARAGREIGAAYAREGNPLKALAALPSPPFPADPYSELLAARS